MARVPMKFDAGSPVTSAPSALALSSEEVSSEAPSSQGEVQQEHAPVSVKPAKAARLRPIPTATLEGLGMMVVGMIQIPIDGTPQVVPVGLAPYAGSDTEETPGAGFFIDDEGQCGILLNGNDGAWQKALPIAVEEARRALTSTSAS